MMTVNLSKQSTKIAYRPLGVPCGSIPGEKTIANLARISVDWESQDPAAWRLFGRLLWLEGQCSEALAAWQKAADMGGVRYIPGRLDLATGLYETGDRARSVTEFRKIGAAKYLYNIAALELNAGRRDSAQNLYELALDVQPIFPQAITLAQIYLDEGNSRLAAQVWLRLAQSLDENNPDHWLSLGQAALLNQNWEAAIDDFQSGIIVSKDPTNLYLRLGDALGHIKDWNSATKAYERSIELDPKGSIWPYYTLGNIALAQGQYELALDWYDRSRIVNPRSEMADFWAGQAALQTSRLSEAELHLRAAQQINPQNADVLSSLAYLKLVQGDLADALLYGEHSARQYYSIGQLQNYCNEIILLKKWYENIGDKENLSRIEMEQTTSCMP